jgi:hypothetical protein
MQRALGWTSLPAWSKAFSSKKKCVAAALLKK